MPDPTEGHRVLARLTWLAALQQPLLGRGKGMLPVAVDDDEHLQDWAEYMPQPSSFAEVKKELRAAGGDAWDDVDDPKSYLERASGEQPSE